MDKIGGVTLDKLQYEYGIKAREVVIAWYQHVGEPLNLSAHQVDTLVREIEIALREGV